MGELLSSQVGPYPWGCFLTSMPVWAIIVANFTENWRFYTLLTQLPNFMKDTMDFNLEQVGLVSALPYLVMAASIQGAGLVADWLLNHSLLTTTQAKDEWRVVFCISSTIYLCGSIFYWIFASGEMQPWASGPVPKADVELQQK